MQLPFVDLLSVADTGMHQSACKLLAGVALAVLSVIRQPLPYPAHSSLSSAVRSGRMGPLIMVGLVAYSVGVTIYAAGGRRPEVAAGAAAAASQQGQQQAGAAGGDPYGSSTSGSSSGSNLASLSVLASTDAPESMAEALAAAAVAPAAVKKPREKKEDKSEVCKVCGGSGQVRQSLGRVMLCVLLA